MTYEIITTERAIILEIDGVEKVRVYNEGTDLGVVYNSLALIATDGASVEDFPGLFAV